MSEIRIEDLDRKREIEPTNLIIVEDDEDTKKAMVQDLIRSLCGDAKDPSPELFYSTLAIQNILSSIGIGNSATTEKINELEKLIGSLTAVEGSSNSEVIAARLQYSSLLERLAADQEYLL